MDSVSGYGGGGVAVLGGSVVGVVSTWLDWL